MKLSRVNVSLVSLQMEREGKIDESYVIGIEEVANELLKSDDAIQKAEKNEVSTETWIKDILKFGLEKAVLAVRKIKYGRTEVPRLPSMFEVKQMEEEGFFK